MSEFTHQPDCRWQRTTPAECEYRATHHYCPHAEHACSCPPSAARAPEAAESQVTPKNSEVGSSAPATPPAPAAQAEERPQGARSCPACDDDGGPCSLCKPDSYAHIPTAELEELRSSLASAERRAREAEETHPVGDVCVRSYRAGYMDGKASQGGLLYDVAFYELRADAEIMALRASRNAATARAEALEGALAGEPTAEEIRAAEDAYYVAGRREQDKYIEGDAPAPDDWPGELARLHHIGMRAALGAERRRIVDVALRATRPPARTEEGARCAQEEGGA